MGFSLSLIETIPNDGNGWYHMKFDERGWFVSYLTVTLASPIYVSITRPYAGTEKRASFYPIT